jgi:predicted SAM-dependent methyltransferase
MKLHVGCGPIYLDGFYNIDIRKDVKTDYCGSIFSINIKNEIVDFIWSCHMLEHLDYPRDVVKCLKLFNNWMKSGATLRLALPDVELIIKYYINNDKKLFELFGNSVDDLYYKKHSKAERFQFFMRGWEHTIVFDYSLISELLKDAGFKNIKKMDFCKSRTGEWNHDRFEIESMYVECVK